MTDVQLRHDEIVVTMQRWRTRLTLIVRTAAPSAAAAEFGRLLGTATADLERAASRFRNDSELSALNRAGGRWTEVSSLFVQVLSAGLVAAERTDGLVDPCLGHLVDAAGYRNWRDGSPPPPTRLSPARSRGCWQRIEVRPAARRARVRIPRCCRLDLGAVGKAWLADRLVERVVDGWGYDAVADMGGDIRAVGRQRPWTLAADPRLAGWKPSAMSVTDAGLATSGQGERRWTTASGAPAHHIIDPRTGRSAATPWWTASVLAADAAQANTAATAAMVLGTEAPGWLAARGLDAWLVPAPGGEGPACVLGQWPGGRR